MAEGIYYGIGCGTGGGSSSSPTSAELSDPLQCLRRGRPLGPGDFSQPAAHSINWPLNEPGIIEPAAQFPRASIVTSTLKHR